MSFTILQKNATITASEVNDNFLHVGRGDLLPRGGTSLTAIGSTYNLGSDQYRWETANINNIYAGAANISKISGNFYFLDSYEINSINTATTRISFDITGYSQRFFEAHLYLSECTSNAYCFINGNTTNSRLLVYAYYESGASAIVVYTSTTNPIIAISGTTDTANSTFAIATFSNVENTVGGLCMWKSVCGTNEPYIQSYTLGVFDYTYTSAITSLVFTGKFQTGASIKLWGIA